MNVDENEIPHGARRIYHARINGDIIRIKYKKQIRDKFSINDVYKDGEEQSIDSYFMRNMRIRLKLDKNDETFTITKIEKLKYIGFSLPEIK